jgi:N-methylhydantoinase B
MGVRRVVRSLAPGLSYSLLFERSLHPAEGACGGGSGRVAGFALERDDGTVLRLSSKTTQGTLDAGERLVIETAGGGGWGGAQLHPDDDPGDE